MRIGLDITQINLKDGSARYTQEVVKNLCALYPENHFICFGPKPNIELNFKNFELVEIPAVVGLAQRLKYTFGISRLIKKHQIDVFHNLSNYGFLNKPCPMVSTVQDLISLKFGLLRNRKLDNFIYKYIIPLLLKTSNVIVVSSESTKNDVAHYYGFTDNVKRIYLGYDIENFDAIDRNDSETLQKFNLNSNYIFFAGYITPKKNLQVILKALAMFPPEERPTLAIAGKRGFDSEPLFQMADNLKITKDITELGFVSDQELSCLYRNAKLFVFPSIYEGFGLPALEALACGTPSLVSKAGSLPEIVTEEDLLCDPHDAQEWFDKIQLLVSSNEVNEKYSSWGLNQSKNFSWQECAKELMQIYQELVEAK